MAVADDNQKAHSRLTFGQIEGLEPMPRQLTKDELPRKLRARLLHLFSRAFDENSRSNVLSPRIKNIVLSYHVDVKGNFGHSFNSNSQHIRKYVGDIFEKGSYVNVYNFIKHFIESKHDITGLEKQIDSILKEEMSAYRIVGYNIVAPISSEEDIVTIKAALDATQTSGAKGAQAHIRGAVTSLNSGEFSDSVRHSISAVESVAKVLSADTKAELSKALARLERSANIHGGMKAAFNSLYGYTSDEKGVRHSLLFEDKSNVDEADALFMIGACSAFVSYLISRAADAGISVSST